MSSMQYSERFLNFVQQQLMSFQADQELEHVVVYVARSGDSGSPTLEVVGQWPKSEKVLQPVETDTAFALHHLIEDGTRCKRDQYC